MKSIVRTGFGIVLMVCAGVANAQEYAKDTGYRGIWYYNQKTNDEYVYKYSGGLGTYCAKHIPLAIYAPEVNKTFFVYGGTKKGEDALLEMVSYYDHATGQVPRPTILIDKKTSDAHDNPVISIDDDGHIWVFASSHGKGRPSYIFQSKEPYNTDDFNMVLETNFSYPQPWHLKGKGFLFLLTSYDGGRALYWQTSDDGKTWSDRSLLALIDEGHYQVSWPKPDGATLGTAFNYHPKAFMGDTERKGLNWRTNLYYAETPDMGEAWRNVQGETLETPLRDAANPALVRDYQSEGLLCYMKDVNYDTDGNPVILHVTAKSWMPGPEHAPREWRVAHWTGSEWAFHTITQSDNNYDTGSIHIESDGTWRVFGPTETGPQPFNPGGEVAMWTSSDKGVTWTKERQLTSGSPYNHTYCRRPLNAHPDFYAFWADGHGRQPSDSRLYISDKTGENVRRFPYEMSDDLAALEPVE
ncbi:MAG: hypothetical protein AMXMBFR82_09640 [Candidatus Hydrogenedentota bacterium]